MTDANRTETLDERHQELNRRQEELNRQHEELNRQQAQIQDRELEKQEEEPGPTDLDEESREPAKPSGRERAGSYLRENPLATLVLVLVVIGAVGAGVYFWIQHILWETTDDAQVDGHIASISARIGGHVSKVYFENNQPVNAGQLMVEIDPTDYDVAVQQAKAGLDDAIATARAAGANVPITAVSTGEQVQSSEAGVASAREGITAAERNFAAAQANVRQAEASNAKAQSDLERYQQLIGKDEISKQQYDQAVTAAAAAAAAVDAARAAAVATEQQVAQARDRLRQAEAELRSARTGPGQVTIIKARQSAAEAQVEKSQAQLQQAELNLSYTKIYAPVSGAVGRRSVEIGQNVQPGQDLMAVVPLDDLWVTANYKETQIENMREGQQVKFHVDALDKDFTGKVLNLAAASGAVFSLLPPENATGNYVKVVQRLPIRLSIDPGQDPDRRLRPGMSVEPSVRVK